MIIDAHAHIFPDTIAQGAIAMLSSHSGYPAYTEGTADSLLAHMKQCGVDKSVLLPVATRPNQVEGINRRAMADKRTEFIHFGAMHPDFENYAQELELLKKSGIPGVKMHCEYQVFSIHDKAMFPLYEVLQELDLMLYLHAGEDIGFEPPYHCTPEQLARMLDCFPNLRVCAAHMGGYRLWDDVKKYLAGRDNLYLDTAFAIDPPYKDELKALMVLHGMDKIFFGTDTPWRDIPPYVAGIRALELPPEDEEKVFSKNILRAIGRETEQVL